MIKRNDAPKETGESVADEIDIHGAAHGTRKLLPFAKAFFFVVILLACGYLVQPAGAAEPSTLRLLLWQAPTSLNPHFATGAKDQVASRIVYEPLASFTREGQLVPFLAAEIPSIENGLVAADGMSVTWKLKQNILWSDGQPFTARDVVFTYKYVTNKDVGSSNASVYKSVNDVVAIDDHTVKVVFKKVNPAWAIPFVGVKGMIIPEHVFAPFNNKDAATAAPNLAPVGTGPYKLKNLETEDILLIGDDVVNTYKLTFEKNPLYREADGLSFDTVTLQGGGDAALAAEAVLKDGAVDFAWNLQLDAAALAELQKGGKGQIVPNPGSYVERIVVNFTDPNRETEDGERSSLKFPHPSLTDLAVRKALSLAIERQRIAELYGPGGNLTGNILVAPTLFSSPNTSFAFDRQEAARLLVDAGWKDSNGDGVRDKNGVELSFVYQANINPVRQAIQQIVKEDLEAIGFHVENKMVDSSIFFSSDPAATNSSDHFYADLESFAWGNKTPDPGAYMAALTCAESAQKENEWSGTNSGRYCNADYDKLYEKSAGELNPLVRAQLFVEMNDLAMKDVALIPLVNSAELSGLSTTIEGYEVTPWDAETWKIANWKRKN